MKFRILLIATILLFVGTPLYMMFGTENSRAKRFGGTMNVELPQGQKLFDVTWKENSIWYATRPMRSGETAEVYSFQEDSALGIIEGKVIFTEQK
jgi:hypothetical protein